MASNRAIGVSRRAAAPRAVSRARYAAYFRRISSWVECGSIMMAWPWLAAQAMASGELDANQVGTGLATAWAALPLP